LEISGFGAGVVGKVIGSHVEFSDHITHPTLVGIVHASMPKGGKKFPPELPSVPGLKWSPDAQRSA